MPGLLLAGTRLFRGGTSRARALIPRAGRKARAAYFVLERAVYAATSALAFTTRARGFPPREFGRLSKRERSRSERRSRSEPGDKARAPGASYRAEGRRRFGRARFSRRRPAVRSRRRSPRSRRP